MPQFDINHIPKTTKTDVVTVSETTENIPVKTQDITEELTEIPASTIGNVTEYNTNTDLGLSHNYTADELPVKKIAEYVKGYKWKVDYYNLAGNINTRAQPLSLDLSTHSQNYTKIKGCILYLQSPLDNAAVQDLGFSAVINCGIVPFKFDFVVAEMIGGKKAIFECTEIKQEHYQTHELYELTFKFKFFLNNTNTSYFEQLDKKVIRTYIYNQDYLFENSSPLLLEADYKLKEDVKNIRLRMLDFYFKKFIDIESKFLCLNPRKSNNAGLIQNGLPIIDNYMLNYIRSTIDVSDSHEYKSMSYINYAINYEQTVFDALLERNIDTLEDAISEMWYVTPKWTATYPDTRGVYYSDAGLITVPKGSINNAIKAPLPDSVLDKTYKGPLTELNFSSDSYIFSINFYKGIEEAMLPIERLIYSFIKQDVINMEDIEPYLKDYRKWSLYEQYYLIPILAHILLTMISTHSER